MSTSHTASILETLRLIHQPHSYPKHVWSPAGGWYAQPANWRTNTAIMGAVVVGITAMAWSVSADREHRDKMPEVRIPGSRTLWTDDRGI